MSARPNLLDRRSHPDSTAQAHALRRLALKNGGRIGNDLDWETGKVSYLEPDSDDNPSASSVRWRADIVRWAGVQDEHGDIQTGSPAVTVIEVKNVAEAALVDSQLQGYIDKFRAYGIASGRNDELNREQWAVKYKDPSNETWYAWAPPLAGHVYFGRWDDSRVPEDVKNRAHWTGQEAVMIWSEWSGSGAPWPIFIRPRPPVPIPIPVLVG